MRIERAINLLARLSRSITFRFDLLCSVDNDLFSITGGAPGTGTVGITRPVDFETAQNYRLTIMVMNNNAGVGEACAPLQPCKLYITSLTVYQCVMSWKLVSISLSLCSEQHYNRGCGYSRRQ